MRDDWVVMCYSSDINHHLVYLGYMLPELFATTLTLRPRKFNRVPCWLGRAAQAHVYASLQQIHPLISQTIHDAQGPKPFTISNLLDAPLDGDLIALGPDMRLRLRYTTLHPHMSGVSLHGIIPNWRYQGISLHDQPLVIQHAVSQSTSYADLLDNAPDTEQLCLEFQSLTAFKGTKRGYVAYPEAALVFKSLLGRWNFFTSDQLPDDLITHIHLLETEIRRETLRLARGKKGVIPGFTGHATYLLHDPDPDRRRMIHALAAFAEYGGVGIKTTIGMGQASVAPCETSTLNQL